MKGFLLAAGLGTRLRPLTFELPKPVWPLFDVPLAVHVLHRMAAAGVDDVVVNLHHLPDILCEQLAPWIPNGLDVRWSREDPIQGTGGALDPWRTHLRGGPFFLANADTYQELDLVPMLAEHQRTGALATLVVRPLPHAGGGPIEVAEDGRIVRFLESRAPDGERGRVCEFSGVHLLQPEVLGELPHGPCCINRDVHAALVERGERLYGYQPSANGFWSDLGTPRRYLAAHEELLIRGGVPELAPGRVVRSDQTTVDGGRVLAPSYLGPGARVASGAVVGPAAVLGRNAVAGDDSRVARSVLWAGAVVAPGERLSGAIRSAGGATLVVG